MNVTESYFPKRLNSSCWRWKRSLALTGCCGRWKSSGVRWKSVPAEFSLNTWCHVSSDTSCSIGSFQDKAPLKKHNPLSGGTAGSSRALAGLPKFIWLNLHSHWPKSSVKTAFQQTLSLLPDGTDIRNTARKVLKTHVFNGIMFFR